ncbi:MAG TPA: hypothetical protein PKA10_08600 [Selenomonadales bacterium]|nr:hypothetical protein [Selenomonadales bacterium]
MLTASVHMGRVGLGATTPQLFRASDGKVYVVKLQNNRLGPKVLANELLGSKMGEILGLSFPRGGVIKLEEQVIKRSRILLAARVTPGRHYACEYLSHTGYITRSNLGKAANRGQMAGVMLFDHMFHNLDRTFNRRNLLVRQEREGLKIYAIDNSHLFRRGRWTVEWLEKLAPTIKLNRHWAYGWLLKHYLTPGDFAPYLERIQAIPDSELAGLVAGIPQEWLPQDSERQALERYLITRRDMIEEIAVCLRALIPNKHRGSDIHMIK